MTDTGTSIIRAATFLSKLAFRHRSSVPVALAFNSSRSHADSETSTTTTTTLVDGEDPDVSDRPSQQQQLDLPPAHLDTSLNEPVHVTLLKQLTFGSTLGFATGMCLRAVGKVILFFVGAEVCVLQYMVYRSWIFVDWNRIAKDMSPTISAPSWDSLVNTLVYRMPFATSFTGGLYAGLKLAPYL